jgi:hypothetical protein
VTRSIRASGCRDDVALSRGRADSLGTLAVSAAFGASWFAYYEPRPSHDARSALDRELYRGAGGPHVAGGDLYRGFGGR